MNIEDFNNLVANPNKNKRRERLRFALLGDALIAAYGIEVSLAVSSETTNGQICGKLQVLQTNERFISFIRINDIGVPKQLTGKAIADYFEAWVGYLHLYCSPEKARAFCFAYFHDQMGECSSDTRNICNFTEDFLADDETEEVPRDA